jgi:hypothetical protein
MAGAPRTDFDEMACQAKLRAQRAFSEAWCGRGDSNPHALASASPSSWCVCQFRHFRGESDLKCAGQITNPHRVYGRRHTWTTQRNAMSKCSERWTETGAAESEPRCKRQPRRFRYPAVLMAIEPFIGAALFTAVFAALGLLAFVRGRVRLSLTIAAFNVIALFAYKVVFMSVGGSFSFRFPGSRR